MTVAASLGSIRVVSVNVALPEVIGLRRGEPVLSGIGKRPVAGTAIWVGETNLEGDRQADLQAHGGPDKAVYAYPAEHVAQWSRELNPDVQFGPGAFGENLTTAGWLEEDVRIGDVWAWGDALLQVAQPRYPCFKLGMATGRPGVVKQLVASGRTGWYLRVLRPGTAPVADAARLVDRGAGAVTVREAHLARLPGAGRDLIEHVLTEPALAIALRQLLREHIE